MSIHKAFPRLVHGAFWVSLAFAIIYLTSCMIYGATSDEWLTGIVASAISGLGIVLSSFITRIVDVGIRRG